MWRILRTLRPPRGVCEARLHQSHKPCGIGAIPSKTYGSVWWCQSKEVCVCIAPLAQGLWTWWRQASKSPRGGLKRVPIQAKMSNYTASRKGNGKENYTLHRSVKPDLTAIKILAKKLTQWPMCLSFGEEVKSVMQKKTAVRSGLSPRCISKD